MHRDTINVNNIAAAMNISLIVLFPIEKLCICCYGQVSQMDSRSENKLSEPHLPL